MCHLTKDIVEGIATGFLQIQPAAVSALILDTALPDGGVSYLMVVCLLLPLRLTFWDELIWSPQPVCWLHKSFPAMNWHVINLGWIKWCYFCFYYRLFKHLHVICYLFPFLYSLDCHFTMNNSALCSLYCGAVLSHLPDIPNSCCVSLTLIIQLLNCYVCPWTLLSYFGHMSIGYFKGSPLHLATSWSNLLCLHFQYVCG